MSVQTQSKQQRIKHFLQEKTQQGKQYFKSKYIAKELDLSSRAVGQYILKLKEDDPSLSIEKFANSRSTTWLIEPAQKEPKPIAAD